MKSRTKPRQMLLFAALGAAAGALCAWPLEAAEAARAGLALCGERVIPALFPFFVLSALVIDLGAARQLGRLCAGWMAPLFRLPGACAAGWVLGLIGGYPVGARTAERLYRTGACTREEAQRLLSFCNACGPAFILGVVGAGVFQSRRAGLLLWLTHALSALLIGVLLRGRGTSGQKSAPPPKPPSPPGAFSAVFSDAVRSSCTQILNVCAFVVLFTVIRRVLEVCGALELLAGGSPFVKQLLAGTLEVTSGVCSLTAGSVPLRLTGAAFLLGWGGLCVHCQSISLLGELSPRPYLAAKALHGILAAALTYPLSLLVPLDVPVGAFSPPPVPPRGNSGWLVLFALALVFLLGKKIGGKGRGSMVQ